MGQKCPANGRRRGAPHPMPRVRRSRPCPVPAPAWGHAKAPGRDFPRPAPKPYQQYSLSPKLARRRQPPPQSGTQPASPTAGKPQSSPTPRRSWRHRQSQNRDANRQSDCQTRAEHEQNFHLLNPPSRIGGDRTPAEGVKPRYRPQPPSQPALPRCLPRPTAGIRPPCVPRIPRRAGRSSSPVRQSGSLPPSPRTSS